MLPSEEIASRAKTAHYIATNAGSLMLDLFHREIKKVEKSKNDYVSELDRSIESMAQKTIIESFPEDGFAGEEYMPVSSRDGITWIVDPIDGTNNYLRGLPLCGFQLAILHNDAPVHSVIYRPFTQELFTATKGEGAVYKNMLTGEESGVRVSDRPMAEAVVIYDSNVGRAANPSTNCLLSLADHVASTRVFGVAVFDLPAIASGVAEVLITGIAQPYDIAPGWLLVSEAGGLVYNRNGQEPSLDDDFVIISNRQVKDALLSRINQAE